MFTSLTNLVLRHPIWTILITLFCTLIFVGGMPRLTADTDVTNDLPQDIPAKQLYDRIDELFPAKEMVIIGITGDELFSADGIAKLHRLTKRIEDLAETQSVLGPTNARIIAAVEGGLEVREAADPLPTSGDEATAFKKKLFAQPLFVGTVVSRDARAVAMLVFIKAQIREADAAEKIIALASDPQQNEGLTLHITGRAAATYWSKVIMATDMSMLSSAALGIVLLLLILIFRSFRGVLLPLGVVVTAVLWTMGLMGYVGQPLTHSTEILPILLIAIGVADGIHILKGYFARARSGESSREVVRQTMADLNRPVILTSITTAIGFLALGTSGVDSITALGMLTAFGVMAAMLFSITFLPAVLCLLPLPARSRDPEKPRGRFLIAEKLAARYAGFLVNHRVAMTVIILLIVGAATYGATLVPVEFSNLTNFRPDHPFRLATEKVNEHFASSTSLTVVIETGEHNGVKKPEVLAKMDDLATFLRQQPHVGTVQSLSDYIKQIHQVMGGGYRIPAEKSTATGWFDENGEPLEREVEIDTSGQALIAQYLMLYEMSGKPDDFANVVTYDYSTARMSVLVDTDRATVLNELHHNVRGFIDQRFGGLKAELTGMAELMRAVNEMVVTGQAWSIATSLLLVFLVTALMFRAPALGLFSTLPLFFSLFLNFGTMGLTGIPLNIMTMATSSVAVGVGIDYAIHFVHRYQQERRMGAEYGEAAITTMRHSGVAIFLNALTVAAGFFALFFSEFKGVAHMGALIALTMLTSAFAALTILPVLFVSLRPKAFVATSAQTKETA